MLMIVRKKQCRNKIYLTKGKEHTKKTMDHASHDVATRVHFNSQWFISKAFGDELFAFVHVRQDFT